MRCSPFVARFILDGIKTEITAGHVLATRFITTVLRLLVNIVQCESYSLTSRPSIHPLSTAFMHWNIYVITSGIFAPDACKTHAMMRLAISRMP
jgi:hypothetical protein